jgi:hypothetical protein
VVVNFADEPRTADLGAAPPGSLLAVGGSHLEPSSVGPDRRLVLRPLEAVVLRVDEDRPPALVR